MNPQTEPNSAPEQQKTPIVPPPPPKSRLPLLLTFVLLVVLILFGGYKLMSKSSAPLPQPTPTQSPTASTNPAATWETYTNTDYGFSFNYPAVWYINIPSFEGKHQSNKTVLRVDITNSSDFKNSALLENKKDILNISVSVWDNENGKSFDSVVAEWDNFFQNPTPDSTSLKEINNIAWTQREFINISNLPIIEYTKLKGKYLYVVEVSPGDSSIIDSAYQILSTFTFLSQNQDNIISWEEAVELIESCQVKSMSQTHNLDVNLTLLNNTQVRTKEPIIDEVFNVAEDYSEECGIPLEATE
ncbi:hypothetical protein HYT02_05485 [Candidatus Gottesmanbacteria bacterium]|nr:hypothetical protein [Candidatus Gottesmanbacteria bacterium]